MKCSRPLLLKSIITQDVGKGGSLHDGFGGLDCFGGSGEHLALLSLVLQTTGQKRGGCDGFAGLRFRQFRFRRLPPLNTTRLSGNKNHVFGTSCLCPCDFRHFRRFHGVCAAKLLYCWLESIFDMQFSSKPTLVGRGQRHGLQKAL